MDPNDVGQLVERFHTDRNVISQSNRNDVAVVFVAERVAQQLRETDAVHLFRQTAARQLFAPFDGVAQQSVESAICYVLRSNSANGGDFEPYYCRSGSPEGAVMHYRVEFEILVRKLFEKNYKYIMKPIVVDRCVLGTSSSATTVVR